MTETGSLAAALARVQAALPHVGKDKTAQVRSEKGSYSYRYADLADIAQAIHPLLSAEGLAWTAKPTLDTDGRFVLAYSLLHGPSGEREDGTYPLPDPTRSTPQQIGSAITYGRRYCLTAVTGVAVDDDDDGQAAAGTRAARGPIPADEDVWQTPVVTDTEWADEWRGRVERCTEESVLRGLYDELVGQHQAHKVTDEDRAEFTEFVKARKDALVGEAA
jgi:hypothetical protein